MHDYLSHLGTINSVGLLRSGHLVVNVGDSIQLLATDYARPIGTIQEISHIYPLYNDRAICARSRDRRDVNLLDMETMKILAHFPIRSSGLDPSHIICASIERRIIVFCSSRPGGSTLKLVIDEGPLRWEEYLLSPVLLGALSPDGNHLIIVTKGTGMDSSRDGGWELRLKHVLYGTELCMIKRTGELPSDIGFTSVTRFYTEDRWKISILRKLAAVSISTTDSEDQSRTVAIRRDCYTLKALPDGWSYAIEEAAEEVLPVMQSHRYTLDDDLEWVVDARSRRVCWLPPGYVSRIEDGHFFVGSSIVMVGQDGVVRKLTFIKPDRNRDV